MRRIKYAEVDKKPVKQASLVRLKAIPGFFFVLVITGENKSEAERLDLSRSPQISIPM